MQTFTRYLSITSHNSSQVHVAITDDSPLELLHNALNENLALRYSPILPAYLEPNKAPPPIPEKLTSIAFFFSRRPYNALGLMKPELTAKELGEVYFTQGLASILCLNCDLSRALELREHISPKLLEFWPLDELTINPDQVIIESDIDIDLPPCVKMSQKDTTTELAVYVEQILACIATLRQSYATYNPEELKTLDSITQLTEGFISQHNEVSCREGKSVEESLVNSKKLNSITSALAELGASLSYAVTQGTSGCSPILSNRSPFPQFSLLGIGGSVRAITKFTRYMELAFETRDVSEVLEKGYSCRDSNIPVQISVYRSGSEYKFPQSQDLPLDEEFDLGGDFQQNSNVPLIAYFSARHGFKESKFALTAASESLTSEVSAQWSLMTLSHEIMHNRVREIFQTLFGSSWGQDRESLLDPKHFTDFIEWYMKQKGGNSQKLDSGIRNAILNFCCAMDRAMEIKKARSQPEQCNLTLEDVCESYSRHKPLAMELFVHFHDYYFSYACQPMMYIMSLWASWTSVAAPYSRPLDYLVRTLATVACGTGSETQTAFYYATEQFEDSLRNLERKGIQSPLFEKLRALLKEEKTYALFKPSYYLMDQVRLYFASRKIASRIDRIDNDPFAEGSTLADDYSANVFVYGEDNDKSIVSPIRYSLASFLRSMCGQASISDSQWLTAWNTIVISSQEVI